MEIKITCPECNSNFNVKEEYIWKKGKCPKCWNIIEIKKNDIIEKKEKPQSRIWFSILFALAIWAFFTTWLSPWFFLLAWWALFLLLYIKYIKIEGNNKNTK